MAQCADPRTFCGWPFPGNMGLCSGGKTQSSRRRDADYPIGAVGLVFRLLGFFNIVGVLVSGIPAAAAGVASDIVLAVVAKKEKNKEATTADPVGGQD